MSWTRPKDKKIKAAYQHCLNMAQSHYENFPVASYLLPKAIRLPVAAIYAFARRADDLADEGSDTATVRLIGLSKMEGALQKILQGQKVNDPVFIALADTIQKYRLPGQLFKDLLSAFRQDVTVRRYHTIEDIYDYARRSANPIGRLLLHLSHNATENNLKDSDAICTALQLINFYQDIQQDLVENDRVYIPLAELHAYQLSVDHLRLKNQSQAMRKLLTLQYQRAQQKLIGGAQLGKKLKGRFGFEVRMIIAGGLLICKKLLQQKDLYSRPRLNKIDWCRIVFYAVFAHDLS